MKKTIKKLALFLLTIHIVLFTNGYFVLADKAPTPASGGVKNPFEKLTEIAGRSGLPQYNVGTGAGSGPHESLATSDLGGEIGIPAVLSPIMYAIDLFRFVVSSIAIVVIVIASIKLISTSTEEDAAKSKNNLIMGIIGLLIIQMADVAVKKVFFGETGDLFVERGTYLETYLTAEEGGINFFRGILGFINILIGAIAILVLVVRGFTLIVSGGDEEAMGKAKKHVLYAIIGLVVVGISEIVVRGVIFPARWENVEELELEMVNVANANTVIISLTNYISSFVSILAFVALFFAGYKYVISGGNEEAIQSVKKTFVSAFIALLLAMGAFAIVNTLMDAPVDDIELGEETAQSYNLVWHQELPY